MNDDTYLAHHGIKGMKWGVRRTPEQLGHFKKKLEKKPKSAEEKKADLRKDIIKHPKKLYKNRDMFTKDEIRDMLSEIEFDRRLKDVKAEETRRGFQKIRQLSDNIQSVSNLANNTMNAYNTYAKVNNALVDAGIFKNGKRLTAIGETKKEDRSAIDKIVRGGSAEEVYKNVSKMTGSELDQAMKRLNYEEQLKKKTSGK